MYQRVHQKNIMGKVKWMEINTTPHLLVAGATGSGTAIYQDGEDEVHYTVTFKLLKDVMSTPWNIEDVESFLTLHEDEAEITSVTKQ